MLERDTALLMRQHNMWLIRFRGGKYFEEATDFENNPLDIYVAYLTRGDVLHWAIPFYGKPGKLYFNVVIQQQIPKFNKYLSNQLILV